MKKINDNHQTNYDNKKSFNGIPPAAGETLVPFFVAWRMTKHGINPKYVETWHIGGRKIPVAFTPVPIECKPAMMKMFWEDVRNYIASGCSPDFCSGDQPPENGHESDLSLDKFIDDSQNDNDDDSGFEPPSDENLEETVMLAAMLDQLVDETTKFNPLYGEILRMLKNGCTKGEIADVLPLGKSQAYSRVKEAQELAKKFFGKE
jgi:hypothetical protein